ncbi:hypothetical protein C0J45_23579, partial [Silurus meridionalis]
LKIYVLILFFTAGSFADKIGPTDTNIVRKEKDTVKLKCSYESSSTYVYLYWYRQYPNSTPQFLLFKGAKSATAHGALSPNIPPRTSAKVHGNKQVDLHISSAAVSDSALYYCALTPTVTGNPTPLYKKHY